MTATNPRLIACVRPSNWPIDRRRRRRSPSPSRDALPVGSASADGIPVAEANPTQKPGQAPIVLIQTTADRQVVVAACDLARAAGVRPGLSLAQARALCPTLTHADHDPAKDAKALEALARWMTRFTPRVCLPSPPLPGRERVGVRVESLLKTEFTTAAPGSVASRAARRHRPSPPAPLRGEGWIVVRRHLL